MTVGGSCPRRSDPSPRLPRRGWECSTQIQVRKILSILLLAIFGLPLVSPLLAFGADADASLPICCRKDGKHHCMRSMGESGRLAEQDPAFRSLPGKCPYCPATVVSAHADVLSAPPMAAVFALSASHPAGVAQAESKRRISRDRSRQKRGPPLQLLS